MSKQIERRTFLQSTALATAGLAISSPSLAQNASSKRYEISLAQWSLNRQFFGFLGRNRGDAQKLDPQDVQPLDLLEPAGEAHAGMG